MEREFTGLNNYLEKLSSSLQITFEENEKIKAALKLLQQVVSDHLGGVLEHFCFGSYKRGTKLTNLVDKSSDVDYLIVFNKAEQESPDDLVERLTSFVTQHFSEQNIIQLRPTCIVEINAIQFELIPAYKEGTYLINYKIPTSNQGEIEWIPSVPNEFNFYLTKFDSEHENYIIPIIRILKYWNLINKSIYSSFLLEQDLMFQSYPKFDNISEYFFYTVESLSGETLDEAGKEVLSQFKSTIDQIKNTENEEVALHLLSTVLPFI